MRSSAFIHFTPAIPRSSVVHACSSQSTPQRTEIGVCHGPSCTEQEGGKPLLSTLRSLTHGSDAVQITPTGCLGECGNGPNVSVCPFNGTLNGRIVKGQRSVNTIVELLSRIHFVPDKTIVEALLLKERADGLLSKRCFEEAVKLYDTALQLLDDKRNGENKLRVRLLCNRSACLLDAGLMKEALKCANEAVDLDSVNGAAWRRKALAHAGLRENKKAVDAWELWGKIENKEKEAKKEIDKLERWSLFRW